MKDIRTDKLLPFYDAVVLGSGISGMGMSLLLAGIGEKVLLLEKNPGIGGSMRRFSRSGIPFDTGFHFTQGLSSGSMGAMLQALGIREDIEEIPLSTQIYFEDTGNVYPFPRGQDNVRRSLCERFPDHQDAISRYFKKEKEIFLNTPMFDPEGKDSFFQADALPEDFITLESYLQELNLPEEAKALLASFMTCHGSLPDEISLADHCRVSYGLMDDMVRFKNGGQALINAFLKEAQRLDIHIWSSCTVDSFSEITRKHAGKMRLTDGKEIGFNHCIMTIHPSEILRILPPEVVPEDFRNRVKEFQDTCSFFTLFGRLLQPFPEFKDGLYSCFSDSRIEQLFGTSCRSNRSNGFTISDTRASFPVDSMTSPPSSSYRHERRGPGSRTDTAADGGEGHVTGIMLATEDLPGGEQVRTLTAFQSVHPRETLRWENTSPGKRPADYAAYKERKSRELSELIFRFLPPLRDKLEILDSASMLTYRDYLPPIGSAYGIRRKTGQFNLFGRLPLRNCYAAGQNALLPGAMGALLSSFAIFRKIAGEEKYLALLRKRGLGGK